MDKNEKIKLPSLLKLQESYESENWGGNFLGEALARSMFLNGQASSSIEFSTGTFSGSKVLEGHFVDMSVPSLVTDYPEQLLGPIARQYLGDRFDFEARFICPDSSDTPVYVIEPDTSKGPLKNNGAKPAGALLIISALPGSSIYFGKRKNLDEKKFTSLLRMSPGPDILQEYSVNAGQALAVPCGLPFAIGKGTLVYFVCVHSKNSSSLTKLQAGKSTIKKGGSTVTALTLPPKKLFIEKRGWVEDQNAVCWLLAAGGFAVMSLDLRSEWTLKNNENFSLLTCLSGTTLINADDELESISQGKSVVAAACAQSIQINPGPDGAVILRTWFPDFVSEMETELGKKGMSAREISGLFGFFGKDGI